MARRRIVRPDTRVSVDPVTHKLEVTVLDALHEATDRATAQIERELKRLSNADGQRLLDRIEEWMIGMRPHTD